MMFVEDASARTSPRERSHWVWRRRLFTAVTFTSPISRSRRSQQ